MAAENWRLVTVFDAGYERPDHSHDYESWRMKGGRWFRYKEAVSEEDAVSMLKVWSAGEPSAEHWIQKVSAC